MLLRDNQTNKDYQVVREVSDGYIIEMHKVAVMILRDRVGENKDYQLVLEKQKEKIV